MHNSSAPSTCLHQLTQKLLKNLNFVLNENHARLSSPALPTSPTTIAQRRAPSRRRASPATTTTTATTGGRTARKRIDFDNVDVPQTPKQTPQTRTAPKSPPQGPSATPTPTRSSFRRGAVGSFGHVPLTSSRPSPHPLDPHYHARARAHDRARARAHPPLNHLSAAQRSASRTPI